MPAVIGGGTPRNLLEMEANTKRNVRKIRLPALGGGKTLL